ncbi:MAG TPA: serine hydrolase domain-containing protein [Luteibacter sp.]|uniref:serine hydrolase domain-containing protein n=1 Tax=Luteibacter sp. TaxID=1886636 RepID=UPI002CA1C66B|nr:serine hydrolase domain-containing protein [Luteibacter sp.]HVI54916.1 serine hydrolase domain-containing protein [Luteibacter sp.]
MVRPPWFLLIPLALLIAGCATHPTAPAAAKPLRGEALDQRVEQLMKAANVPGLAIAIIEDGKVTYLHAYGERDTAQHLPLQTDTVMYAASITKLAFSYAVMGLVDDHRLDLDASIASDLPKPLPAYEKYADLASDGRWRALTPAILLSHRSGFSNYRYWPPGKDYDPNGKLAFYFDPGTRYAYSGEGINLLQFVIENGKGIDVDTLMRDRLFTPYGMTRTAMTWRDDFSGNVAIGYDEHGKALGHKRRESVRAAGSMDTTPRDYAQLLAAMVRGDGLSAATYRNWLTPRIAIRSLQQFPTIGAPDTTDNAGIGLGYGLGMARYHSSAGPVFFKSGHDDGTNNLAVCQIDSRTCVLLMSNSSNGESIFAYLLEATIGETCFPWYWENYIPFDHPELGGDAGRVMHHPSCTVPKASI